MEPSSGLATISSESKHRKTDKTIKNEEGFTMFAIITSVLQNKKGQGMVEYGLILALVSVAAVLTLGSVGDGIVSQFTAVIAAL